MNLTFRVNSALVDRTYSWDHRFRFSSGWSHNIIRSCSRGFREFSVLIRRERGE